MAKGYEKQLERKIKKIFTRWLNEIYSEYKLNVDKIKVLCDLTCIKLENEKQYKLGLGFAQVDLAIYKVEKISRKELEKVSIFKLLQDPKDKDNTSCLNINIPYVILELKSGELTTDGIRARDAVADKIRQIFPFCSYVFIAENTSKKDETLLRQGKHFTNYYTKNVAIKDTHIKEIINLFIEPHIENLIDNDKISSIS